MYNDSRIVLPKLTKPVSFPALMALYESNYLRLLNFLNKTSDVLQVNQQEYNINFNNQEYQIYTKVEEVTKYTALLCIDEDMSSRHESIRMNHFRVRLYHDAKMACVHSSLHATDQFKLAAVPINKTRITELWQQNMYLNKWLEFCTHRQMRKA